MGARCVQKLGQVQKLLYSDALQGMDGDLISLTVQLWYSVIVAHVGPGHCCYRIGPIRFLAGWRKRRS